MIAAFAAAMTFAVGVSSAKDSPDEQRAKTRKMASAVLAELYKLQPTSRGAIQKSAGYAVFDNMGTNLLVVSTGRGSGIAVNSKTKQETFMKMISAGAGLGVGVKDYRVVFVFETPEALSQFLNSGWDASGQADAAAKAKESGGALLWSRQRGAWHVGVSDHEERSRATVDTAGHKVLQERRSEQNIVTRDFTRVLKNAACSHARLGTVPSRGREGVGPNGF